MNAQQQHTTDEEPADSPRLVERTSRDLNADPPEVNLFPQP